MHKRLLVVGVDPGTTLGYAVLDLDRKLLRVGSSKFLNISKLTSELILLGKPLVIACDKKKVPDFVHRLAIRVGARVVSPREDLLVKDKKSFVKGIMLRNDHEKDALASAVFAIKKISPVLQSIDEVIVKENKLHLKDSLREIIIPNPDLNIKNIIEILEKPDKIESTIIEEAIEEKEYKKEDFLKICDKVKKIEKEASILRKQNKNLKNQLNMNENEKRKISKLLNKERNVEAQKLKRDIVKKSMATLADEMMEKNRIIEQLKEEILSLNSSISNLKGKVVLKKLDDLGNDEFEKKNKILKIEEGDILLVDNPSVVSYKVLSYLKDKVSIIVSKKKIDNSFLGKYRMSIISDKNLDLAENEYYAFVDKKQLEKETDQVNIIENLIEDYRRERENNDVFNELE
ncbi:MAG: DUF460 domain-containing protein [Candidatus Woesearchaeota archaeon]